MRSIVNQKKKLGEEPEALQFSRRWIKGWCKEYNISLKHPNKRFSISQDERKKRIISFLKNIWTTRYWFVKTYGVEPIIDGSDQMPLHRNEACGQKKR